MKRVSSCPSCGHGKFLSPFEGNIEYDNDVGFVLRNGRAENLRGLDRDQLAVVEWRVCCHCSLIFCAKRPDLTNADDWYTPLFRHFESRSFDVDPLPANYLNVQEQFSKELFELLDDNGVFDNISSAIHFRCNAGFLLDEIRRQTGVSEVYGLEYFDNPLKHAQALLGADRVGQIHSPEPASPFERKNFDLVILDHFLTHAHNPSEFLDYIQTLLSPQGTIVIFNEQDHARALLEGARYPRGINFFHKQIYKQGDLIAFLRSRGLEIRQLPHPPPRKWVSPYHSMLMVCSKGARIPMPVGDAPGSAKLMRSWLSMHRRYRKTKWIYKPVDKMLKRMFGQLSTSGLER